MPTLSSGHTLYFSHYMHMYTHTSITHQTHSVPTFVLEASLFHQMLRHSCGAWFSCLSSLGYHPFWKVGRRHILSPHRTNPSCWGWRIFWSTITPVEQGHLIKFYLSNNIHR